MIVDNNNYVGKDSRSYKKINTAANNAQVKKNVLISKLKTAKKAYTVFRENE